MIIGLTGTNGAGKTAVADYLRSKGFGFYSLSDEIRDEIRRTGRQPTRDLLTETGNRLRSESGPAVLAERVKAKLAPGRDYVIDSIRNPAEVAALRELPDFHLVHVDAAVTTRYERVRQRADARAPASFEEFVAQERRETEGADPRHQQLRACWELADAKVRNDGSVEQLERQIEALIERWARRGAPGAASGG